MWILLRDPENIGLHLRVPAVGLVAEVRARIEQVAHGEIRQRHKFLFLRLKPPRIVLDFFPKSPSKD